MHIRIAANVIKKTVAAGAGLYVSIVNNIGRRILFMVLDLYTVIVWFTHP